MTAGIFYHQIQANIIIFACLGTLPKAPPATDDRPCINVLSPWLSSQTSPGSLDPPGIVGRAPAAGKQKPRREQSTPESESPTLPTFVKQAILFPLDSASLDLASRDELLRIADWLRQHGRVRVLVVGFCDSLGSESCTHLLAAQRAGEVGRFLLAEGLDASRIMAIAGWEKADPVCRGETPSCQQQNRRARVFVSFSPYAKDVSLQKTSTKTSSQKGGR